MSRVPAWTFSPGRLAARLLVAFAFYAAALDLGASRGLVGVVGSPPGVILLATSGALLLWAALRAARSREPGVVRVANALLLAGAGLSLAAVPLSLVTRSSRTLPIGEGQELDPGSLPGLPRLRLGAASLAPTGPHVLSKTVEIEAVPEGAAPVRIGLFPPTPVGGWRLSVFRFGYAPGVTWIDHRAEPLVRGYVMMGTFEHTAEDAALVTWTPEPNVMMGAGTFPPKLEELVSPPESGAHLFLRLEEATIAGRRRDLRDPEAYRSLVDGRLEDALFFVQVLRGSERVFEGRVRAGESIRYPGGALEIVPDVLLWVDLLATRDPWLAWVGIGLGLLGAGGALRGAAAVGRVRGRGRSLTQSRA